jgi:hypothetical protein
MVLKHGHNRRGGPSPEYNSWRGMIERCTNTRSRYYPNYGGRGITICTRWLRFENFLADMGARPPDKTLDRINTDGNYERSNCRWASMAIQARDARQAGARGGHARAKKLTKARQRAIAKKAALARWAKPATPKGKP